MKVYEINYEEKYFIIKEIIDKNIEGKLRWCLAKDDVTPQDKIYNPQLVPHRIYTKDFMRCTPQVTPHRT